MIRTVRLSVLICTALLAGAALRAGAVYVAPWAGMTELKMTEVNEDLRARTGGSSPLVYDKVPGMGMAGVEMGIFSYGAILPPAGKIEWNDSLGRTNTDEFRPALAMAMVGIKLEQLVRIPVLSMGVHVGYAYAMLEEQKKTRLGPLEGSSLITAAGQDPVGEITLGLRIWKVVDLSLGYRYCVIRSMKVNKDSGIDVVTGNLVRSGDVMKNVSGEDLKLDYSGALARIGIIVSFGPKGNGAGKAPRQQEETLTQNRSVYEPNTISTAAPEGVISEPAPETAPGETGQEITPAPEGSGTTPGSAAPGTGNEPRREDLPGSGYEMKPRQGNEAPGSSGPEFYESVPKDTDTVPGGGGTYQ